MGGGCGWCGRIVVVDRRPTGEVRRGSPRVAGLVGPVGSGSPGWLFEPQPLERVALLRLAVYAFVVVDVVVLHTSGWYHGYADPVWYEPLAIGRCSGCRPPPCCWCRC